MIGLFDIIAFAFGMGSYIGSSWIIRHAGSLFVTEDAKPRDKQDVLPVTCRMRGFAGAIATGIFYVLTVHALGRDTATFLTLAILSVMLLIARLDWQEEIVPDIFVLALLLLGGVRIWLQDLDILDAFIGGAASAAIMALLMAASAWRHGQTTNLTSEIAWGDVTLMFGLGFLIGGPSLPGFWLCAGLAHVLIFVVTPKGREALRTGQALPMAPALCAGAVITLLATKAGWLDMWTNTVPW